MNGTFQDTMTSAALAARLEHEEREYRERKARRALRGLAEAAEQLRMKFATRRDVLVVQGEQTVTVRVNPRKSLELSMRLSFDHDGTMQQWYMVRERLLDEHSTCEDADFETVFEGQSEAIDFIVGSTGKA
jgi:hypothetical protein